MKRCETHLILPNNFPRLLSRCLLSRPNSLHDFFCITFLNNSFSDILWKIFPKYRTTFWIRHKQRVDKRKFTSNYFGHFHNFFSFFSLCQLTLVSVLVSSAIPSSSVLVCSSSDRSNLLSRWLIIQILSTVSKRLSWSNFNRLSKVVLKALSSWFGVTTFNLSLL